MNTPYRRKKFRVVPNPAHPGGRLDHDEQGLIVDGYAPSQMIEDLRKRVEQVEAAQTPAPSEPAGRGEQS